MSLTHHTNAVVTNPTPSCTRSTAPLSSLSLRQLCQLPHAAVQPQQRMAVMRAMRAVLTDPSTLLSTADARKVAALAHYLCDWPLLQMMLDRGLWQPVVAEQVMPAIQLGQFDRALGTVTQALATGNTSDQLQALSQALVPLLRQLPCPVAALQQDAIRLTPLQFHHVADFIWQYADPAISRLCNLPMFPSAEHWLTWLYLCQQEPARHLFAVMHAEYGFIGSVSLQVFDGIGFFYYWLGADFQGQGYGPAAVDVLMQLGRQYLGMQCCYAKVFDYNLISNKAIRKLGFQHLTLRALPPAEAEVFYYLGSKQSLADHHRCLGLLLQQMNSGIDLAELPPQ